jgi:SSS family solute:Na+ symporter
MSTVDSTFNSIATLWSVDIYSSYINKKADDAAKIQAGRNAILMSLCTALLMGFVLLYLKFENPTSAFTHTLNELRYFINCGIVVLILSAILLLKPKHKVILTAFILTVPLNLLIKFTFPDLNYFLRAFWVIFIGFAIGVLGSKAQMNPVKELFQPADSKISVWAVLLALSLVLCHVLFS